MDFCRDCMACSMVWISGCEMKLQIGWWIGAWNGRYGVDAVGMAPVRSDLRSLEARICGKSERLPLQREITRLSMPCMCVLHRSVFPVMDFLYVSDRQRKLSNE